VARVSERPLVIVSNRGPLSFSVDEQGALRSRRGAGGLVSDIGPLVVDTPTTWIAAAISDGDRLAAEQGRIEADGFNVATLAIEPALYRQYYDVVCNATLWFVHHGLFDLPRRPTFDHRWHDAWTAYREVNRTFADAVAAMAPDGALVLVQDYQLCLVASRLAELRPDLTAVHFSHTPFASPDLFRVLPDDVRRELVEGLGAYAACGFHTDRWAASFEACATEFGARMPPTFVAPLAPDPADLERVAASDACQGALDRLDESLGGRQLIVRVDRIEMSKNLLRGFRAFDELLARHAEHRGQVMFGAFVYPSREGLPDYLAYRQEVEGLVRHLNLKWASDGWEPIVLDMGDDFPTSVAALRRYDVLLVNPIRDGLNLVAKEGPLVNERHGALVLSREAGAWAELSDVAVGVNPIDISDTADALHHTLTWSDDERRARGDQLRRAAAAGTPQQWLDALIRAGGGR
jgi:trehalose 6-phosphate synthase